MLTIVLVVAVVVEATTLAAALGLIGAALERRDVARARELGARAAVLAGGCQVTCGAALAANGRTGASLALLACGIVVMLGGLTVRRLRSADRI